MYRLINDNNLSFISDCSIDIVFSDYVYESTDFRFIDHYWKQLKKHGYYVCMTDFHSIFELGCFMKTLPDAQLFAHLVWRNEWGNHPKWTFHECFDDIVIFTKGESYKFYPDRIQVAKTTANTKLNPSGRQTKTATAWIDDICLTTTSKERVRDNTGHLIRWQKPQRLYQRILDPISDKGDLIVDTHMGSGSLGMWCIRNERDYIGIEIDKSVFEIAKVQIESI